MIHSWKAAERKPRMSVVLNMTSSTNMWIEIEGSQFFGKERERERERERSGCDDGWWRLARKSFSSYLLTNHQSVWKWFII